MIFERQAILTFVRMAMALLVVASWLLTPGPATAARLEPFVADEGAGTVFADGVDLARDAASAHSVETADLDGDGDLDAVSASRMDGNIRWYRNEGGADAFTSITIESVPGTYLVIAGDVDSDGDADLMVASVTEVNPKVAAAARADDAASGTILWYENDGSPDPSFQRHIVYEAIQYPVSLHAADLDNDGDLDLMSASRDDNRVLWYENNGDRFDPAFSVHTLADDARGAVSVHAADFDNDGDLDVVSASENDDQIAWYENRGSQPLQFAAHVIRYTSRPMPLEFDYAKAVRGADVDGDGDQDIVFGSEEDNLLGWYENVGGTPSQFRQHIVDTRSNHAKFVTANDVDLDGDVDLFVASTNDHTVAWYENDGASEPGFRRHIVTTDALGARYIHVADLDNDGDMDVLTASRDDNRITWYRNRTIHRSALFSADSTPIVAVEPGAQMALATDLDRDGDPDLLAIGARTLTWHENRGDPASQFVSHSVDASLNGGRWAGSGDLDQNGDADIVVVHQDGDALDWYQNDGQPTSGYAKHAIDVGAGGIRAAPIADIDGDGDLDLLAASPAKGRIVWYENSGGGTPTFALHVVGEAPGSHTVLAADLNRDGRLDLVAVFDGGDSLAWYENQGGRPATFVKHGIAGSAGGLGQIVAADLDRDGRTDLLAASEMNSTLVRYRNMGGNPVQFQPQIAATDIAAVRALQALDLDHDGDFELVAAHGDGELVWYEGYGQTGAFARHDVDGVAVDHFGVADVDEDGDPDLLAVVKSSGVLAWIENQGGQYSVTADAAPTSWLSASQPGEIASFTISHRGRLGDGDIVLASLAIRFEDGQQRARSTEQVQRCLDGLYLYRDLRGFGRYEPIEEELVASMTPVESAPDGVVTFDLPDGKEGVRVGPYASTRLFVAGAFKDGCDRDDFSGKVSFVVTPETARDAATGAVLAAEEHGTSGLVIPRTIASSPALFINEVDRDGEESAQYRSGWIEIYNAEFTAVDLGGMYLSNDPADPTRYRIPDGVSIPPHGHRIFVTDGQPGLGAAHTNFSLGNERAVLALYNSDGWGRQLIDSATVDMPAAGRSRGRYPDGSQSWTELPPSPESVNHVDELPFKTFLPIRDGLRRTQ